MLTRLMRFEWRYHTRQISFIAAALLFGGIGFTLTATKFGPANVHINSPYSIAESLGLASLASVFALAVFCASSAVRDREHQMDEIVFSTPVTKRDYLLGRFAGSFLAAFTAFCATPLGMAAALAMPWQEASRIGPVNPFHYVWPLLVLVLPGMLAAAVTLFTIATLTRSTIASVVGAVGIYVFYFVAAALTNSPLMAASAPGANSAAAASLLDPFGLSAFFEQTRFWTPTARDARLFPLSGDLLVSRLVWLGYSAMVWLWVSRRFALRVVERKSGAIERAAEEVPLTSPYLPAPPSLGRASAWKAFVAATRIELRTQLLGIPFLLLTALWAALAAAEISAEVTSGEYGSALYPATGLILPVLAQPLSLVAMVIIIYYSAEMVWRERSVGISEILNATPARNGAFILSKWAGLSALVVVLVAVGIASGTGVQLALGYMQVQPQVMLGFAWFMAAPLILFALAAVVIQTLSPQKYAGMLFVLVAGVLMQKGDALGIEHPLLRFGWVPGVDYSGMNGFGDSVRPFHWFLLLWSAVGAALLIATARVWRTATGDRSHLVRARRIGRTPLLVAAALLAIAAVTAAFIFYNTNILNRWSSNGATLEWKAAYEKKYAKAASLPQPRIAAIHSEIAIYPENRRVHLRGTLDLQNEGSTPIETVLISTRREARVSRLALQSATLTRRDDRFGTRWFRLNRPLQPHERVALSFDIDYSNDGFTATPDHSIVANGTFLFDQRFFPTVGYRRSYEIRNPAERKKRGLPSLPPETGGDMEAEAEWVDLDVTLSTDADQIALAPGTLVSESRQQGRRFFHYRSDKPLRHAFVFLSGHYAVGRARAGHVSIEVYHDPSHGQNVERIAEAAAESIRTFEHEFGPYPHDVLRIAEVPSYWPMGGFATPGLILLSENRTFLIDARDPHRLDLVTRRTAHEVAHQWWGHFVAPVDAPGASMIVETLTKYSELLVLEKKYGRDVVRKSLEHELDLYLAGRTSDESPEVPLVRVTDQPYLYYRKGAIVMNGVRDLLGTAALNRALSSFAAEYGGPNHHPTGDDLVRSIESAATAEQRPLIEEWMREIVLYDLQVTSADVRPLNNGQFEVTLKISAARTRVDANGSEHPLPLRENIEIALFATDPEIDASAANVLYTSHQQLQSGVNSITIIVPKAPLVAAVDPYLTRVDRSRFDNVRKVERH